MKQLSTFILGCSLILAVPIASANTLCAKGFCDSPQQIAVSESQTAIKDKPAIVVDTFQKE